MLFQTKVIQRKNKEGKATSYSVTIPIVIVRTMGLDKVEQLNIEWREGDEQIIIKK